MRKGLQPSPGGQEERGGTWRGRGDLALPSAAAGHKSVSPSTWLLMVEIGFFNM